ncbi:MAG: DUF1501 domain-containing protein [Candidatus Hydrogenedentes bacterium]|nr:DUF1501 domain-containing protein [Candidatus Hydrogenedentota bacterium]
MNPQMQHMRGLTRRHFLQRSGAGLGAAALSVLLGEESHGELAHATPQGPHFAPKAKRVIYLHMAGSPTQLDLFDYKPKLKELNGELCPQEFLDNARFAFIKGHPTILGSPYDFKQNGESGAWISELLPHLQGVSDELCIIRSMHTDQFNHAPAQLFLYTGSPRLGRPSMGSWLTYGLGSENQDLPGFVVLVSGDKTPSAGKSVWGSGFLPTVHQGVQCRTSGDPVLYASDPPGMDRSGRRRSLDALNELNELHFAQDAAPETQTRIAQYELAYRMQLSVPEVMDIADEPAHIHELYGSEPGKPSFANNCLLARRLVEKGTRFVQLFDWGWDTHGTGPTDDIVTQLPKKCKETDQPVAALIRDLKQRGLLEDTLVVWSGEFGRTAMNEARNGSKFLGRDHHPGAYTLWMAGGGVKAGAQVGATDELGYNIADTPIHIHDFQATLMHLMGFDHERLTYHYQGRDFRLTDVFGHVRSELMA